MNDGKLITAQDATNILDAWATLKTHRPFKEYELHEVTIKVNDGTLTFICEDYIIRDTIATFHNVRQQKSYVDTATRIVPQFLAYNENGTTNWRSHTFEPITKVCARYDFNVTGYTVNGDKTAHTSDIINIDSYVKEPTDKWYTTNEELAVIQSTNNITAYNLNMIDKNRNALSEKWVDHYIKDWEENFALHKFDKEDGLRDNKIRAIDFDYDNKLSKYKVKWVGKLLVKKEKYPPRTAKLSTIPIPEDAKNKYLKALKDLNVTIADGMDTTYLIYALGRENKNAVEDVEYTEVK